MTFSMKECLATFGIMIAVFLCYVTFAMSMDWGRQNNIYVFGIVTLFVAMSWLFIFSSWDWGKWAKGEN